MPAVPPPLADESQLLLDALAIVHHDLGGVAAALQMRGDALDLGAPPESGRATIQTAADELKRLVATLQMLQAVRRVPDGPVRALDAEAWAQWFSPVLSGMMGRGFRLSTGALLGEFPARLHEGLGVSMLAFASALRQRNAVPDASSATPRRLAHALLLTVQADVSLGEVCLSWDGALEIDNSWSQLAAALADRRGLPFTVGPTKACWRWNEKISLLGERAIGEN